MDIIEGEDCIRREEILAVEMSSKEGEEEEEEEKEGRGDCLGKGGREKGKKRREKKACDQGGKGSSVPFRAYIIIRYNLQGRHPKNKSENRLLR